ncbi:MAG: hypothetical protein ACFFKA_00185 [Candidatus Thorarchaeota archaeon]
MNRLEQDTEEAFKSMLGKRVQVTDEKGNKITGELQFAGVNQFGHFHVTLGRMPIWPVKRENVKLITTESNN